MHLYELTHEYKQVQQLCDSADLSDPAVLEAVSNALADVQDDLNKKAQAVAHIIKNKGGDIAVIDAEIERLQAMKKSRLASQQWLEDYLLRNMQTCEIKEISCPLFTIKLKDNPPSVVVDDESLIPHEYMRVPVPKPSPDKTAIKKAIQEGADIPGCHVEQKQRIEIK